MRTVTRSIVGCRVALYGAVCCMMVGIWMPFMTTTPFVDYGVKSKGFDGLIESGFLEICRWFLPDSPTSKSIVGGVGYLFSKGEYFTALLILFVSVIFPITKLGISIVLLERANQINIRLKAILERCGPWSLLDAMLVALLVIASQSFPLGVTIRPGIGFYAFSLGVVLSYFGLYWMPSDEGSAPKPTG